MKIVFADSPDSPILPPPDHWRYRIEGSQKAFFYSSSNATYPGFAPTALCVYLASNESGTKYQPPYVAAPQSLFQYHLERYLINPVPVQLSHAYLHQLSAIAAPYRPHFRKMRSDISTSPGFAELIPDLALCFGRDTILVEIKPKSGVLSRSALLPPDVAETLQKFRAPPYYLKKYLLPDGTDKLGELPERNCRYNPVELISGENVLEQLLTLHLEGSRSLRLFLQGTMLTHEGNASNCNDGLCATILDVASRALMTTRGNQKSCLACLKEIQDADCIDNIGALFLLKRLEQEMGKSHAHRMIEEYMYCERKQGENVREEESFQTARSKVSYKSAEEALRLHSSERHACALKEGMVMKTQFVARMLAEFLQAAVAKDCSVMISMCHEANSSTSVTELLESGKHCGVVSVNGHRWLYIVHVVDVGAKSIHKIEDKWATIEFQRVARILAAGGLPELK